MSARLNTSRALGAWVARYFGLDAIADATREHLQREPVDGELRLLIERGKLVVSPCAFGDSHAPNAMHANAFRHLQGSRAMSRKIRSQEVTEGPSRAPARAFMRAMGLKDADLARPLIGVASTWNEATPCNLTLDRQAKAAKQGISEGGGTPREFVTIAVSDGIAMGHEGM